MPGSYAENRRIDKEDVLAALTNRYADFYGLWTPLKAISGELRGPCPLHGSGAGGANFAVNPDTGHWYCFSGCQDGGDVFQFLEKQGRTFPEALSELAAFVGLDAASPRPATPSSARFNHAPRSAPEPVTAPVFLNIGLVEELHQNLMNAGKVRRWLSEHRGLTTEVLCRFQVGLLPPSASEKEWRICFPIFDRQGRLTNIRKHLFAYKPELTDERRRELGKTKPWQAGLTADLYPLTVLDQALSMRNQVQQDRAAEVLIVEGEADALLACQLGFAAITGTSGAGTWHERWTDELAGLDRVTILYDADPAGNKGAEKVAASVCRVVRDVRLARYDLTP